MEVKDSQSYKNAFYIAVIYFVFGVAWIVVSDTIVASSAGNLDQITIMQTYKGWFFVFITTVLLYMITYRFFKNSFFQYQKQIKIQEEHQKEISKSDALVRTIVNSSPDAIFAKDLEGKYILFNESASNIVGIEKDKVIGNTDFMIFQNDVAVRVHENDKEIIATKSIRTKEEELTTNFGLTKDFLVTKGPLFTDNGELFGIFGISRDITAQKQHEEYLIKSKQKLYDLAHHDILTKLPNRLHISEVLGVKCQKEEPFSLILLDLDGFKIINDSYGHRFGDKLIIGVSNLLKEVFNKDATIYRMGGDEFAIILDFDNIDNIIILMERLKSKLNNSFLVDEVEVYVTASMGIAIHKYRTNSIEDLLQEADAAMYNAKKIGKNTYSFYDSKFTQDALIHTQIATNLKKAMDNDDLELYYQSQNDAYNGDVIGVEALLRWRTSDGMIPPSVFIPIAEETGLIIEIGNIVLAQGCKTAIQWQNMGILNGKVAINISPKQLNHLDFIKNIDKILKETQCDPSWIELEITESSILDNPIQAIELLQKLKNRGFYISMDDFGTGYSFLSYLKKLPIDKLKIDQSFIRNITNDHKNQTIVKTIISLAKGLSIQVLAEGVESEDELEFLKEYGIDFIQGYYYAKPLPFADVEEILCRCKV
ncbi:EAL and GGDEF domain-containing protein [Arcobacter sp. FWKO B]|uniref:sensor domain-containing protein n=1 Tax=Arcobacter sp. FWKO B TaxID=2593672 RepID=UPI001906265C|nr:GGDEF and EAL domain-containing protein [Arcobacter sp. FWKO B]